MDKSGCMTYVENVHSNFFPCTCRVNNNNNSIVKIIILIMEIIFCLTINVVLAIEEKRRVVKISVTLILCPLTRTKQSKMTFDPDRCVCKYI